MRKTLTVLTVVLAATSLAACDKFFGRETATVEKPPVPATATETAETTPHSETATLISPATPAQPPVPATPATK